MTGRLRARGRQPRQPGGMNKSEAWFLDWLRADPENMVIRYEPIKLRLADRTYYTPDFLVIRGDGAVVFHEVKGGFWEDDARVKIKVAAETYPEFVFRAAVVKKVRGTYTILKEEEF